MAEGEILDHSFEADNSSLPYQYLDFQGKQFGATFDVLILCNLIFHKCTVLLLQMHQEVKSWRGKVGTPHYRLYRDSDDDNEMGLILKSRVDQQMTKDASVEELGRVACRMQIDLDQGILQHSRAANALHTAVSPAVIEDSIWLSASLLWEVEDLAELQPDDHVCQGSFWATHEEVAKIASEKFVMGVKEDIENAFAWRKQS